MYISPSVWNKMVDDKWKICVYLDGQGKNFHYINNAEEFLKLVEKDDVVIKITGKEKVDVVRALYTGILEDAKGTAYTLIRVAARTNMDAVSLTMLVLWQKRKMVTMITTITTIDYD